MSVNKDSNVTKVTLTKNDDSLKSTSVSKHLDLLVDLGNLLSFDVNDLDLKKLRETKFRNSYLKNLARNNTQLLINEIWKLPTERVEEVIVAKLPKCKYAISREKPVPKPKPLSKWQQFAKDKGIKKTKKDNVTWDDVLKKWVPRHGFKKAQAEKEKNWIIEIPPNIDPYTDMFEKKEKVKKDKVSKNEYQRLRNIAKNMNVKVPSMGLPPTEKISSLQLNSAAQIANTSTASLGKFQPKLREEKKLSKASILQNKKRKLPHNTSALEEQKLNISIAQSVLNKKPKLEIQKAVNRQINDEQLEVAESKRSQKKKGKQNVKNKRSFKNADNLFKTSSKKSKKINKRAGGKNKGGKKRR